MALKWTQQVTVCSLHVVTAKYAQHHGDMVFFIMVLYHSDKEIIK